MRPTDRRTFVPSAFNFVLLFGVWLLLTHTFTLGNVILAAALAWVIPVGVSSLQTATPAVKKPLRAAAYVLVLIGDIIVSNMVVAKQVLGPPGNLRPGFIAIPLDLKEPLPITLLASTISLTPGTVSTEVSEDNQTLYLHALHVDDESQLVDRIKQRYEKPLKEIFGC